ncbi:Golgi membrane protein 1 isoform X2 [Lepisosteus oculatus]|uniref:Golgi membrane protein 1 isoform X2 n=1 Tax=Lepisosteus oculatus TaxID=7918 RepID=UPI0007400722|nr:PREDICTED: Golgi membrane protein 1 isoform X2 [Lepisosteus oculatus]
MAGLGNSRRGGRSLLLIGALIACTVVLGFNYWISSSRNIELQTRVYELEGNVRRAASERGAVELKKNEFQEQLQRQSEQMNQIESLYRQQLQSAQASWKGEKAVLLLNISSSARTIKTMKDQFNTLFKDMGKLQQELQECQRNQSSLQRKITSDMSQCNAQITEVKEGYLQQLSALKKDALQKEEKITTEVKVSMPKAVSTGVKTRATDVKGIEKQEKEGTKQVPVHPRNSSHETEEKPVQTEVQNPKPAELETTEIPENTGSRKNVDVQQPKTVAVKQQDKDEAEKPELTEIKENDLENQKNEGGKDKIEDLENDDHKGNGTEEEVEREQLIQDELEILDDSPNGDLIADGKQNNELVMGDELADYNGDEENVGEFEADKQAELAENTGDS